MPPKSRNKLKGRAKEDMLVTSRLMAIRFLVDDYIYKNKPITLLEAMKFDEEITSLKIKCKQDTRSLQVVEKLKIFMKGIIKEQSTDRHQDNSSYVRETSVDKNPSIAINDISSVENDNTNTLQTNTATLFFINTENQTSELNNITQDINTKKKISKNSVINVRNTEIKQVGSTDISIPNSILKLNDKSEKSICTSKNSHFVNDFFINATKEKDQTNSNLVTLTSNLQKPPEQEDTCLVKENQKPIKTATVINNIEKQTKNIKTPKNNKITAKNIKTKTKKNNYKELVNKSSRENIKTKTKKNINKELENKSSGENKIKKKTKEKTQMNYSWVENLKYVREVSPDEHTDLQIDNNFWNNLSLPGIWNPNEFD